MNYAIILSGGIGTRMHMGDFPKQYYKVKDRMILEYTLDDRDRVCGGNEDLHDPRGSHEFQDHASRGPAEISDDRGGVTAASFS